MRLFFALVIILLTFPNTFLGDVRILERANAFSVYSKAYVFLPDLPFCNIPIPDFFQLPTFILPADGHITSYYGLRRDPINGGSKMHSGLDIANLRDSRIIASEDGIVSFAGLKGNCGTTISILHDRGVTSTYCHLDVSLVEKGQSVLKGDVIGLMGTTGRSTGDHLHFELKINNEPVDPAYYLVY